MIGGRGEEHVRELARRRAARGPRRRARAPRPRRRAPRRSCGTSAASRAGSAARPAAGRAGSAAPARRVGGDVGERRGRAPPRARPASSRGARFMKQVSVVRPRNQPPPRRATPKSSPARKTSAPLGSASSSAIVAFASTSGMSRSSPSRSRLRWCATGSSRGLRSTSTSSPSSSTGKRRSSSANWSNVPPVARSKRAWCQWQVRMPSQTVPRWSGKPMCGQRLSTACTSSPSANRQTRVPVELDDEPSRRAQLVERRDARSALRGLATTCHASAA